MSCPGSVTLVVIGINNQVPPHHCSGCSTTNHAIKQLLMLPYTAYMAYMTPCVAE